MTSRTASAGRGRASVRARARSRAPARGGARRAATVDMTITIGAPAERTLRPPWALAETAAVPAMPLRQLPAVAKVALAAPAYGPRHVRARPLPQGARPGQAPRPRRPHLADAPARRRRL